MQIIFTKSHDGVCYKGGVKHKTTKEYTIMNITKNIKETVLFSATDEHRQTPAQNGYPNSTYSVVSNVAYLIGVPQRIFEMEHEAPKMEYFKEMNSIKNARIIRNLCMLRTEIELHYRDIQFQMMNNMKNLHTLPEYISQDCLLQLEKDGLPIIKANHKLNQYIIDINKHIANRINNCKTLFPWLEWEYVKELFIMPNGLTEAGIKAAAIEYYANKNRYPYQVYINWCYQESGNILYNDKKFVTLLYAAHEDSFSDWSKVCDISEQDKYSLHDFLENSNRTVILVDCENSDPIKLDAALQHLNRQGMLSRISKIILCDDIHTTSAWGILNQFTDIPVEHILTERVCGRKSIVDPTLCVKACMEHYENGVDSIVLFSSDSDYWGLFSQLTSVQYFVMVEQNKFGNANREALQAAGIPFCYIDNFCTGNSQIKVEAMLHMLRSKLDSAIHLNINEMLHDAYLATRAEMTSAEQTQFYDRFIKTMRLAIGTDGTLSLVLGS